MHPVPIFLSSRVGSCTVRGQRIEQRFRCTEQDMTPSDVILKEPNAPVQRRAAQRTVRCNRLLADQRTSLQYGGNQQVLAPTQTVGRALPTSCGC